MRSSRRSTRSSDGNGRAGRAIIHLVLRRRGLAPRVLPPVSLVLATLARDYVGGLTAVRYVGSPSSSDATAGTNAWMATFAAPASARLTTPPRSSREPPFWSRNGVSASAEFAPTQQPTYCFTASLARRCSQPRAQRLCIGRTFKPANEAIQRLVEAGILHQITIGRRNRAYEAPEIIDAFTDLERQLASPTGDTRTSPPARMAPNRRSR